MLRMMTLNVEHFHFMTHIKQFMLSPLQYAISFMTSVKESLKRNFPWAAYYFTSTKGSWYPPSENSLDFMKVKASLPKKKYSKVGTRNEKEEEEMRQWALTYTRGVRQRSVRQETTMDKSGTLPHYLYSNDIANKHNKMTNTVISVIHQVIQKTLHTVTNKKIDAVIHRLRKYSKKHQKISSKTIEFLKIHVMSFRATKTLMKSRQLKHLMERI